MRLIHIHSPADLATDEQKEQIIGLLIGTSDVSFLGTCVALHSLRAYTLVSQQCYEKLASLDDEDQATVLDMLPIMREALRRDEGHTLQNLYVMDKVLQFRSNLNMIVDRFVTDLKTQCEQEDG